MSTDEMKEKQVHNTTAPSEDIKQEATTTNMVLTYRHGMDNEVEQLYLDEALPIHISADYMKSVEFRQFIVLLFWTLIADLQIALGLRSAASYFWYYLADPNDATAFTASLIIIQPFCAIIGIISATALVDYNIVSTKLLIYSSNLVLVLGNIMAAAANTISQLVLVGHLIAAFGLGIQAPLYTDFAFTSEIVRRSPLVALLSLSHSTAHIVGFVYDVLLSIDKFDVRSSVAAKVNPTTNNSIITTTMLTTAMVVPMPSSAGIDQLNLPCIVLGCICVVHSLFSLLIYPQIRIDTTQGNELKAKTEGETRSVMSRILAPHLFAADRTGELTKAPQPSPSVNDNYVTVTLGFAFIVITANLWSMMGLVNVTFEVEMAWDERYVHYAYLLYALVMTTICLIAYRLASLHYTDRSLVIFGITCIIMSDIWLGILGTVGPTANRDINLLLLVFPLLIQSIGQPLASMGVIALFTKVMPPMHQRWGQAGLWSSQWIGIGLGQIMGVIMTNVAYGELIKVAIGYLNLTVASVIIFVAILAQRARFLPMCEGLSFNQLQDISSTTALPSPMHNDAIEDICNAKNLSIAVTSTSEHVSIKATEKDTNDTDIEI